MNAYHVLELVGEGSFGRVHKGKKRLTGQVVALKFMPKVGRSAKELRSLQREIEIMRDLKHPNIVQLFDSFETETEVVVVTEYAESQLFQILEEDGSLPESQVREIACQLVSALYYLHSNRILHRDMKPQNILLGKSGVVKLCDFGFARAMSVSTLVVTSIKGTPLYMPPELVEEKPYDHTADLWSLGCILYELHTGAPPFYTNSIFHLVQLIVRDPVKWPGSMSDTCKSFLKGLLTKDPQKRLSWPDLLHHPFVADHVLVLPNANSFSPLTVTPSPDMLALKLKQVAEKTLPTSGESKLLRKVREQRDNSRRGRPAASGGTAKRDELWHGGASSSTDSANLASAGASVPSGHAVMTAANQSPSARDKARERSKQRGQISRDYEQEFPSVEVGPRLERKPNQDRQARQHRQASDVDSEDYWAKLAQDSDPGGQQKELLNIGAVVPQLKSNFLAFKAQLTGGAVGETWRVRQPLKVLSNLILTSDLEESGHIGREVGLPGLLFELIQDHVENSHLIKQPCRVEALGGIIVVLLTYWEKHHDWVEGEDRLEELTKPLIAILNHRELSPVAPLAASALSLFTQHGVDVKVSVDTLTSLLNDLLSGSCELKPPLPSGWGLCDGLLFLLLHTLYEHGDGRCLDPALFADLWKIADASLTRTNADTDFCSANGLYSFLSAVLFVLIKDPYSCIPLFIESKSKCVHTLGRLLDTECLHSVAAGDPGRPAQDLDSFSVMSCHLLCIPFALDLPSHTMSRILHLYDSCGIVTGLLQVIATLPPLLLELPLSLLSRLLLCDPERSVCRLGAGGFFSASGGGRLAASGRQTPPARTASSLLPELLRLNVLWDSAAELLTLLSLVARCSLHPACARLHLEASVLHEALGHPSDQIRAAACALLGNLDPFRSATPPNVFRILIDRLRDACAPVRRAACRAVGNWLGYMAAAEGLRVACPNDKGINSAGWVKAKGKDKYRKAGGALAAIIEQGLGDGEGRQWIEEAKRTAAILASLIADPDALTRRYSCAALANLLNVDGAVPALLEEDVATSLLRAACTDPHNAVRRAAVATLCLYSQQDATRQVLMSRDASKRLLRAAQHAPLQCDYQHLMEMLQVGLEAASD